ncbi:unnamed protein product [Rhizophagus irregularis]|nr:unnamed protein product [Rhizophagus irregularis]
MSENRHGCIAHHNKIQLRSRNQVKNPDEINISLESKDFHARRLHNRWIHGRTKNNFSKRLGITFNTRYSVNNINNILRKGNTYIYNKIYENFNFGFSKKNNVQRKQRQRFDRKCKHVFRNCDTKDDTLTEDKLLSSKRQGFLFHPLQSYKKCISHLRYKKRYQVPLQKYYNFKLPTLNTKSSDPEVKREVHIAHYFESNRHGSSLDPSYKTESTLDTPVASTANNTWNQTVSSSSLLNINAAPFTPKTVTQKGKKKRKEPIISDKDFLSTLRTFNEEQRNRANNKREGTSTSQVKNFIPDDLLPFIPDEPIYKDGKVYSLLTKKEKATLKPLTEGSKSWRVAIRSIKDAADRKRELETYKDNLALKWETTRYAGEFCEEFTSDLFYVQNSYYDFFTYKNRVDHVTPIDETKGKKPIQNNKNIDSPAFARQHLEELESKKEDSDLILALFLRQQSLYNHIPPEFFVPRERKRRAIDSSNFDYNLHRKKRSRHDIDFSI